MQVPLPRLVHAEHPEAFALLVLHVEIIARLLVAAPPFAADALGAVGIGELVHVVAAAEEDGAAVAIVGGGNHRVDLDWHREQLQRADHLLAWTSCSSNFRFNSGET